MSPKLVKKSRAHLQVVNGAAEVLPKGQGTHTELLFKLEKVPFGHAWQGSTDDFWYLPAKHLSHAVLPIWCARHTMRAERTLDPPAGTPTRTSGCTLPSSQSVHMALPFELEKVPFGHAWQGSSGDF